MGVAAEVIRDEFYEDSSDDVGKAAMPADGIGRPPTEYEAMVRTHRAEVARLSLTIMRQRALLDAHGIESPDDEGRDMLELWRECARVVEAAHALVEHLGTSKELLRFR